MAWKEEAKCKDADPSLFFPKEYEYAKIRTAKAICLGCSVREDCLRYAITTNSVGIWAGSTEKERVIMGAFLTVVDLQNQVVPSEFDQSGLSHNYSHESESEIHIVLDIYTSTPVEFRVESTLLAELSLEVPGEYRSQHPLQSGDSLAECG